jgi:hypothetical protein
MKQPSSSCCDGDSSQLLGSIRTAKYFAPSSLAPPLSPHNSSNSSSHMMMIEEGVPELIDFEVGTQNSCSFSNSREKYQGYLWMRIGDFVLSWI